MSVDVENVLDDSPDERNKDSSSNENQYDNYNDCYCGQYFFKHRQIVF